MIPDPAHQSDEQRLRSAAEQKLDESPLSTPAATHQELVHELRVHQIELEMQNETLRSAQNALEEARDRYVDLYEFAPVGYLTISQAGLIEDINLTGSALFGCERSQLIHKRFAASILPCDQDRWTQFFLGMKQHQQQGRMELQLQRRDGSHFCAQIDCTTEQVAPVDDAQAATAGRPGKVIRAVLVDITQRKRAEEEIYQLGFFDPLTGLPNRRLLYDRLKKYQAVSNRNQQYGAILMIDLDHFKTLNDTHGHDVGDQLLCKVAAELLTGLRDGDTIARLGGDEFVVLLENLSVDRQEAAALTERVAQHVLMVLGRAQQLDTIEYHNAASVGATLFTGMQMSIEELMKQADLAMYKAKEMGRNRLRFFDAAMQIQILEHAALEAALASAIEREQLQLYYQPQIDAAGRMVGAEALLRWQHPERGLVSPLDFIPLAEESHLILTLGTWVLDTACRQLAVWARQPGFEHLTLAINVSTRQFSEADFVADVKAIIARTQIAPQRLKLELTESILINNVEDIIAKMALLKAEGVRFALDDFGTGYSSLSYLKRLPLDQLKIDRSFVKTIHQNSNDAAIASMIIVLAKTLGLGVIAEGVETSAQKDFLSGLGCHNYQGYWFSPPLPLYEFELLVQPGVRSDIRTRSHP
jgi:diguanylate cyclase (GGDEF)-like protein/PAS domain S-box-containing protein